MKHTKKQAKEEKRLFGRTLKTALTTRTCIYCKRPAKKALFRREEYYQEYLQIGFCQLCIDTLDCLDTPSMNDTFLSNDPLLKSIP